LLEPVLADVHDPLNLVTRDASEAEPEAAGGGGEPAPERGNDTEAVS